MPTPDPAPLPPWLRKHIDTHLFTDSIDPVGVEIVAHAPILWSEGTGGLTHAALLRLPDGSHRWYIEDDITRPPVLTMLRERLDAYEEALAATRRLLAAAEAAGADGPIWDAAADEGGDR